MLQTKTYTYGSIHSAASRYFQTELVLTELSVSEEGNFSRVGYTLTLYSGKTRLSQWRTGARISLGGKEYVHRDGTNYANQITIDENSSLVLCSGEVEVAHLDDGTAALPVAFSVYHPTTASYTPGNFTYTGGEITLTPIERATTLGATDACIGGVSMVALSRKRSSYTHSVSYAFGERTGYLTEGGGLSETEVKFTATAVPFSLPMDFYSQLPTEKSGLCTLTCCTYEADTPVGQPQTASFTVLTREADCAPQISGTVVDSNETTAGLTGDACVLVRYVSTALCTLETAARCGAEIVSKSVNGIPIEGSSVELPQVQTGRFLFSVTDSRGYTAQAEVEAQLLPYFYPTANVNASRVDPTSGLVTVEVKGICFSGSFGAAENALSLTCVIADGRRIALTPVFDGESYTAQAVLDGFDYAQGHTFCVEAADLLHTLCKTVFVQKGVPVFHWREDAFFVNVPACISGIYMRSPQLVDGTLSVCAQGDVFCCGAGVYGILTREDDVYVWHGTQGLGVTAAGEYAVLTFPSETAGRVLLLSADEMTII